MDGDTVTRKARRAHDAYYTPTSAVETLIALRPHLIQGDPVICEPCVGDGAIAKPFADRGIVVITNDLVPSVTALHYGDAAYGRTWETLTRYARMRRHAGPEDPRFNHGIDWVITNPPFVKAYEILSESLKHARFGVAMFLRLSFLEPTDERGPLLSQRPPDDLIAVPRISFTGDGDTDSVICVWLIWYTPEGFPEYPRKPIVVVPKVKADTGMELLPL